MTEKTNPRGVYAMPLPNLVELLRVEREMLEQLEAGR